MAVLAFFARAAYGAAATGGHDERRDLNVVIPLDRGTGLGRLVVHGGAKRDPNLDGLLVASEPKVTKIHEYGDAVVSTGKRQVRVPLGQKRSFAIPADPKRLQMWTIGDLDVLMGVVPGEVVTLWVGGCCSFWNVSSVRLDPSRVHPPVAYCSKYEESCRPGFLDVLGGGSVDPLCRGVAKTGAETKRCMIPGAVRVVAEWDVHIAIEDGDPGEEREAWDARAGETSEYVAVGSETRDYWNLRVGTRYYLLVIGPGEKWTVKVKSDGGVSGVRDSAALTR
jgi:hypothetical protein